ncbi:aspartate ammonia-lyase [Nicoliella spurrieriana]|uniref:Aspartate ammonia-lyase n=1 Tax=Nicoliella spurrieriana TaxID=2925830 RepID=A0A976RSX8_9LACO|nr:aspartate ammonia-lyase [Nicoliella spurrieriana]UQS87265.1 aspartate ammonia-lyase [Nicoliella spurrieriana]
MRIEKDCVGEMEVPDDALYGIHALRAVGNFPITKERTNHLLIQSYIEIKKAAAQINANAGTLDRAKASAIVDACDKLLHDDDQSAFIVPAIQGGAGTSTNMNTNEVVANVAMRLHPEVKIHPNDDVNQSQSTNDTYPTAGKMAMLKLITPLCEQVQRLVKQFKKLSDEYQNTIKVGRTQLQDAVPTTYGKSFHAYATLFGRDLKRINSAINELKTVSMGGTAIGTGINASKYYQEHIVDAINVVSGLNLAPDTDLIDAIQNSDHFITFSGVLKTLALDLSKVSNDFRLLGSGPKAGLNELALPKRQAGSSIMPDKINPVIPEVVNQVAFEVAGFDTTVSMAAEAGQLELNAFEPIMFKSILTGEEHLTMAVKTFVDNCLNGLKVNVEQCAENVDNSAVTATVLSPKIGYEKTTKLIKKSLSENESVKKVAIEDHLLPIDEIDHLFSPAVLTNDEK